MLPVNDLQPNQQANEASVKSIDLDYYEKNQAIIPKYAQDIIKGFKNAKN